MISWQKYTQEEWASEVESLFAAIYPHWNSHQCRRMAYSESSPLHILTVLAVHEEALIGQLNVFRVGQGQALSNIGYHVHPSWHRCGVASYLLCKAWPAISSVCSEGMLIQIAKDNAASKNFAIHAGFTLADKPFLEKFQKFLRINPDDGDLAYHYEYTTRPPNKAVQRTALRAATDLNVMGTKAHWHWNGNNKVGPFKLLSNVSNYNLKKLERFPEEDCDTYEVPNSNHSKVYSKKGSITSIQCNFSFIHNGVELVGKETDFVTKLLSKYYFKGEEWQLISSCHKLKLFSQNNLVNSIVLNHIAPITKASLRQDKSESKGLK